MAKTVFQFAFSLMLMLHLGTEVIGQDSVEPQALASISSSRTRLDSTNGQSKNAAPSFANDVVPIFSKLGCNSGACHGALAGKGGLRLSLHGYDPASDYFNISKQARGRRLELAEPGRSMILTKPTAAVPHKGGKRFDVDSDAYKILAAWIAAGAIGPDAADPTVELVTVTPDNATIAFGAREKKQLKVFAQFSDGTKRDVTRWAKFASTNDAVTQVDQLGNVDVIGPGQSAITAWYSSKIDVANIVSPFPNQVPQSIFKNSPRANFIDDLVLEKLEQLKLPPSSRANDHVFVRRAFLDTIGTLPTVEEVEQFVSDSSPDKRKKLIDHLLDRPEFVDYWSYQWSDLLLINGTRLRPKAVKAFYDWIRNEVKINTPWDEFTRKIITAQGSSVENGATNFFALHQDPENMAENASQAFLGLSIACAKCHNHPLEKWTNDQYYAFANMFSRVRAKGWGGDGRNGDGVRTLFLASDGELLQPNTGRAQKPAPLDGQSLPFDYQGDRRVPLANWMTSPDNPYFARAITNKIWARFFGAGLVENSDDMRLTNPPSNQKLLDAAARYLIDQEFDLKKLMRVILLSETYGRSSQPTSMNESEVRFYSRYYPRRLMAEVLLDGISQVTEIPTEFNRIDFLGADSQKTDFYPKGTRAIQLYDSAVKSYFLRAFGRNQREITCECQRSDQPSMVQVLHISNGDTLNKKLEAKGNRIEKLIESGATDDQIIRTAYLLTFAREPTQFEFSGLRKTFKESANVDRRLLIEDLFWSLMSSREFLFNH